MTERVLVTIPPLAPRSGFVAVALLCAACASTSPKRAFDDTAALVEARSGHRVTWNRGNQDDAKVADRIRALLQRELTADGAVQIALLQNHALEALYEELSVAQADLVQAGLLANPVFGAGIGFPVAGNVQTGVSLSVSQDFLSVFSLAARKKIAKTELAATEFRVADAVLRTTYDVLAAYYGLVAATQLAATRRTILTTSEASADLARRQRDAGDTSDLDFATQEAATEQVRLEVLRGDADVIVAREALTRLLGLWNDGLDRRVATKLPELPVAEPDHGDLETRALEQRLDLAALRKETLATAEALGLARDFRWLGSTSLGATYDHAPEGFTTVGPTAGVELPLFDQKQGAVAKRLALVRASRAREEALAATVRSEVRAALSRLSAMRALVQRYASVVVPLRQRIVALAQEHYDAMLLGTPQLLLAKENEVNAYRDFIAALRDYWIARADLERALGGPLPRPVTAAPAKEGGT